MNISANKIRATLGLLFVVGVAVGAAGADDRHAHGFLRSSSPSDGDRVETVPTVLRLTFSEPVETRLTRVTLTGPEGDPVPLSPLLAVEGTPEVILVEIVGRARAGGYTVAWRTVGADGHPAEGTFAFEIAQGAAGLDAAPGAGPAAAADGEDIRDGGRPEHAAERGTPGGADRGVAALPGEGPTGAAPDRAPFGVGSPVYAAIRWLTFVGLVGVIGVVAFGGLVLPGATRRSAEWADVAATAAERARRIGVAIGIGLFALAFARLAAQAVAVSGAFDADVAGRLLIRTPWGAGWLVQVAATATWIAALVFFGRSRVPGGPLGIVAATALAFTPALSGHAVAEGTVAVAVVADALHVVGAGGWLGSLALVLAAGIPATAHGAPERRGAAVAALVHAFSPLALGFAGILVATGGYAAWLHVGSLDALVGTDYGRTLLVKLGVLAVVFGAGAYNFLRVKPTLEGPGDTVRLRRSSIFELTVAVVVLAVTAVLVATPPSTGPTGAQDPTVAATSNAAVDGAP